MLECNYSCVACENTSFTCLSCNVVGMFRKDLSSTEKKCPCIDGYFDNGFEKCACIL